MVETVNNLLQPQAQAAWRELSTGEQLRAATMLLDTVEQGAFVLADNLLKTDIVQENTDNIREYRLRLRIPPMWLKLWELSMEGYLLGLGKKIQKNQLRKHEIQKQNTQNNYLLVVNLNQFGCSWSFEASYEMSSDMVELKGLKVLIGIYYSLLDKKEKCNDSS